VIKYSAKNESSGIETFKNGDVYEGAFKNGLKHGKGVLTTRNNRSYEGHWANDKPHGFGINTFPNGKIYTGNFNQGKPTGDGQWTYTDGRIYNGTWVNGAFLNKDNSLEIQEYKVITTLINIIVIGAMLSFVIYWLLKFLKII